MANSNSSENALSENVPDEYAELTYLSKNEIRFSEWKYLISYKSLKSTYMLTKNLENIIKIDAHQKNFIY